MIQDMQKVKYLDLKNDLMTFQQMKTEKKL